MRVMGLFTRTLSIIFSNAALWAMVVRLMLIYIVFGQLVGPINVLTGLLIPLGDLVIATFIIGALVKIFDEMATGQNPSIVEGFKAGWRTVFPLALVLLILAVPLWIVVFIVTGLWINVFVPFGPLESMSVMSLISLVSSFSQSLPFSLSLPFYLLVALATGAIAVGAERAVVLEVAPVTVALIRGWNLLRSHLSNYLKITLVALLVSLVLGLLMALSNSLVIGPRIWRLGHTGRA